MTAGPQPELFLFYDNGPTADSRILVFGTEQCLRALAESELWFMDGNFDVTPKLFLQLYVILIPLGDAAVSIVYALMERKTQESYEELFRAITSRCESLGCSPYPEVILTDFEKAAMNAAKEVFGSDVKTQGCFFHMTQSTWRKLQDLGLVPRYREDEGLRLLVSMLDALAFLPVPEVEDGFRLLRSVEPADVGELVMYFETNYVLGSYRNVPRRNGNVTLRRVPPRFPPEVWNVHDATMADGHRTNNQEAWNRRFGSLLRHSHPSVHRLIDALRLEEGAVSTVFQQEAIGVRPQKRVKPATVELQARLRNLCSQYVNNEKTIEEFLRGVARTIRF
ncbi:uncharacterized protein LOC135380414 [Ornithodoros turicata]|uniref:uncharacterized protein LOC135380414 n=1 Tax=Ornithodoros turicata TaxID=34597 RepID=UPI00313A3177